jgi:hypothetical protein
MRIRGKEMKGYAEAVLDEETVASQLGEYLQHVPMAAKPMGVRLEKNGKPHPEDAARLAQERLFVKIEIKG